METIKRCVMHLVFGKPLRESDSVRFQYLLDNRYPLIESEQTRYFILEVGEYEDFKRIFEAK